MIFRNGFLENCVFLYETDYIIRFTTSINGFWDPFCNSVLLILTRILHFVSCIWETDFGIRFVHLHSYLVWPHETPTLASRVSHRAYPSSLDSSAAALVATGKHCRCFRRTSSFFQIFKSWKQGIATTVVVIAIHLRIVARVSLLPFKFTTNQRQRALLRLHHNVSRCHTFRWLSNQFSCV